MAADASAAAPDPGETTVLGPGIAAGSARNDAPSRVRPTALSTVLPVLCGRVRVAPGEGSDRHSWLAVTGELGVDWASSLDHSVDETPRRGVGLGVSEPASLDESSAEASDGWLKSSAASAAVGTVMDKTRSLLLSTADSVTSGVVEDVDATSVDVWLCKELVSVTAATWAWTSCWRVSSIGDGACCGLSSSEPVSGSWAFPLPLFFFLPLPLLLDLRLFFSVP